MYYLQDDIKDEGDIVEFVRKREVLLVGQYKVNNIKLYQKYRLFCFVFYIVDWSFDYRDGKVVCQRGEEQWGWGGGGERGRGLWERGVIGIKYEELWFYFVDNVL